MILFYWSPKGGSGTSTIAAATALRLGSPSDATESDDIDGSDVITRQGTAMQIDDEPPSDRPIMLIDLCGDMPTLLGINYQIDIDGTQAGISDLGGDSAAAEHTAIKVTPNTWLLPAGTRDPLEDTEGVQKIIADLGDKYDVVVDGGLDPKLLRQRMVGTGRKPVCVVANCYMALSKAQHIPGPYEHVVVIQEDGRALRVRDVAAALDAQTVEPVDRDPRISRAIDAGTIVGLLPAPLRKFTLPTWDTVADEASGDAASDDLADLELAQSTKASSSSSATKTACRKWMPIAKTNCIEAEGHAGSCRSQ